MIVETRGIVLKESPLREKDKRLVIYTKNFGKIVCFAKNVRKKNIAVASVLSYSDLRLFQNRDSYQLIEGTVLRSFEQVKKDIFKLSYAMYLLEFVDYVGKEELENKDLLKLLIYGINAIEKNKINLEVIKAVFDLKLLQILGFEPELSACIHCGSSETSFFSAIDGGTICPNCKHSKDMISIDKGTLAVMAYIFSLSIEDLFSFDLKENQRQKFTDIIEMYVKVHIDYKFKTLEFLKSL